MTDQWHDAAATHAPGWIEPTRATRLQAFDYSGRYGASLVAVLLGTYLVLNVNAAQLANAMRTGDPLLLLVGLVQIAFAVAVLAVGLAIAPAPGAHRLLAVAIVVIVVVGTVALIHLRITGTLRFGGTAINIVVNQAGAALFAATSGWLIVRRRPAVTWLLLLLTPLPGLMSYVLLLNGVTSLVGVLVLPPVVCVLGVGIAWVARGIARATTRPPVFPAQPAAYPADGSSAGRFQ